MGGSRPSGWSTPACTACSIEPAIAAALAPRMTFCDITICSLFCYIIAHDPIHNATVPPDPTVTNAVPAEEYARRRALRMATLADGQRLNLLLSRVRLVIFLA